jgi:hypothetical protein
MRLPGADQALLLKLTPTDKRFGVRLRVSKNRFLTGVRAPGEDYVANVLTQPGQAEVTFTVADFHGGKDGEKSPMKDWANISTLSLEIIEQGRPLPLSGSPLTKSLDWIQTPAR